MTDITFDPDAFRASYKQFSNKVCFTDDVLQAYFDTATQFVTPTIGAMINMTLAQQTLVCNLATAHIAAIFDALQNNKPLNMVSDASIDKVRVSVKTPPVQDGSQFQWWLNLTPYGVQILAMFNTAAAGGFMFGGLPERSGVRRVGGGFGGIFPGCPIQ